LCKQIDLGEKENEECGVLYVTRRLRAVSWKFSLFSLSGRFLQQATSLKYFGSATFACEPHPKANPFQFPQQIYILINVDGVNILNPETLVLCVLLLIIDKNHGYYLLDP
jgi:hypothetical protein